MTQQELFQATKEWLYTLNWNKLEGSYSKEIGDCTVSLASYDYGNGIYQGHLVITHSMHGIIYQDISCSPLGNIISYNAMRL